MAKKSSRKKTQYFDYGIVFIIILLLAFGLVMLYSTSSYTASLKFNDAAYFVKRQAEFAAIGLVGMYIVSRIDYHIWTKFALPLYIFSIALVIYALLFGANLNNSSRWIYIGPISIQPSEICKLAVIIFFATLFSRLGQKLNDWKPIITSIVFALVIAGVVAISNLSTAVIIAGIFFAMLLIASNKTKRLLALGVAAAAAAVVVVLTAGGYRSNRIQVWFHPENYDTGYQTLQGLYAIGSGGLLGKGLGESMQKQFVPEAQNDMIFSIICEELGFFGAALVFVMFFYLLWRLLFVANHAKDRLGFFIAIGIMVHIALQVILNIAVVTNSMPNTGVTLPFISYGGSALVMLLAELGVALSVSRQIEFEA